MDTADYTPLLTPMFAEVLVLDEVGPDDSFFDLDGDSLAAIRLITMITAKFGVTVTIGDFFSEPTVHGVAKLLRDARPGGTDPSPRDVLRPQQVPLSFAQEGVWFADALSGWSGLYNVPVVVRLAHEVDRTALEAAVRDLVVRHEILRTCFPEHGGVPHQEIGQPDLAFTGIRDVTCAVADLPTRLDALVRESFDVTREVPLRTYLVGTEDGPAHLVLLLHHLACDGLSVVNLVRELDHAYGARRRGNAPTWSGEVTQYADYAVWHRQQCEAPEGGTSRIEAAATFWRDQLRDAPGVLALPAARPRQAVPSGVASHVPLSLSAEIHAAASELARAENATMFMVLQAVFALALSESGAGNDIVLGTPVSGRTHPDLEDAVGLFVNLVALRTDLSGNPAFRELLARVRAADLAAYQHADIPFQKVVEAVAPQRRTNVHPVVQVAITLDGHQVDAVPLTELGGRAELSPTRVAKFDLELILDSRRAGDGTPAGLEGRLEYATDLYDAGVAEELRDRFLGLLTRFLGDPGARIT